MAQSARDKDNAAAAGADTTTVIGGVFRDSSYAGAGGSFDLAKAKPKHWLVIGAIGVALFLAIKAKAWWLVAAGAAVAWWVWKRWK